MALSNTRVILSIPPSPISNLKNMLTREEEEEKKKKKKGEPKPKAKKPKRSRALKIEAQNAHFAVVLEAARTVTGILKSRGITSAVFGSLASKLYGCARYPKDVDLLVSQVDVSLGPDHTVTAEPLTAEQLKNSMLDADPRHFYLKMPRDPSASYRILEYRSSYLGPECKVDILVPGTMHLPHLEPEHVRIIDGIPVVPFSLLLYHKLQGWDDHCQAEEKHKRQKQLQDAADVKKLLGLKNLVVELAKRKLWEDTELFSEEFRLLTEERVKKFCEAFKERTDDWAQLGFETS